MPPPPRVQSGAPMSISAPGIDPYAERAAAQYPYPQRPAMDAPRAAYPQSAPPRPHRWPRAQRARRRRRRRPARPDAAGRAARRPSTGRCLRSGRRAGRASPARRRRSRSSRRRRSPVRSSRRSTNGSRASVQPAAHKWFGQPVVEIKQISAYSCRGMNGQVGARISEHAFGNALDIAAFVLADGKRITIKGGWQGSAEEQGFLRDVQAAACDQFTTVLAPGSNRYHYDHIHVDLMRRASGRRICQPGAVDGELVAARVRKGRAAVAARPFEPPPTRRYDPPFDSRNDPFAWRGDSGGAATSPARSAAAASRRATSARKTWIGSKTPARARRSTGARTGTRFIEGLPFRLKLVARRESRPASGIAPRPPNPLSNLRHKACAMVLPARPSSKAWGHPFEAVGWHYPSGWRHPIWLLEGTNNAWVQRPTERKPMFRNKSLIAFLAVAATLAFVAVEAMAAPRMNSGSRGNRTHSAPPATQTAPNAARPIERTMTTPRPAQPARRDRGASDHAGDAARRNVRPLRRGDGRSCRRLPRRRPDRHADGQRLHGRHGGLRLDARHDDPDRPRGAGRRAGLALVAAPFAAAGRLTPTVRR